jgi:hypothetical protein
MSLFPLYDELYEITDNCSNHLNWSNVSSKISNLTDKEMEVLYSLIFTHYVKENKVISDKKRFVPYKGKLMDSNRGALFNISDIPLRLQVIISAYLDLIL